METVCSEETGDLRVPVGVNTRHSLAAVVMQDSYSMRAEDLPMSDPEYFNVSVSFHRPDELEESAVEDPEPANVIIQDVPVIYEEVDGATSKGGKMLLDNLGYGFTQKKEKALTAPASVQGFVMDFEAAAWSDIRRVFPPAQISGCAFHWTQAVWRKVQNLGLSGAYQQDEGTHVFVRKLLALPLLPAAHIEPAFDYLQQQASEPLKPLMEYVESTWISGTWTPPDWSVYGQSIRTNNDCEGWHRRLNFRSNGPPAFYSLVDQLH